VAKGATVKASGCIRQGIGSNRFESQEEVYSVAACHYGDALFVEVAIAVLLSYLCSIQVMMCSHDGVTNGGASQVARNSKASSAFFCLWPAGESRCGPVAACAALCSANGQSSRA